MRRPSTLLLSLSLGLLPSPALARSAGPGELLARTDGLTPIELSETSWLLSGVLEGRPYQLESEPWLGTLERFFEPYRNHTPAWRSFLLGSYARWKAAVLPELVWSTTLCDEAGAEPEPSASFAGFELRKPENLQAPLGALGDFDLGLSAPQPRWVSVAPVRTCPAWKAPQPVTITRNDGEQDRLVLTDCDGGIPADALDRLSVLARPPGTARPELPLPLEAAGPDGEWLPEIRLLHPRLAWLLARVARSFPGHRLVLYSGYRREAESGLHRRGEALDVGVEGVPTEALFRVCHAHRDAGCGYYPNAPFVHLDVRPFGTGRVAWVDVSQPGTPSRYIDGWPGVLAPGVAWLGGG